MNLEFEAPDLSLQGDQPPIRFDPYREGYALFLQAFLSGSTDAYQAYLKRSSQLILTIHERSDRGPFPNYQIATLYLMHSFLDLYHDHRARALVNLMRSRNYWLLNRKHYPDFPRNKLTGGIIEWILGNIPEGYKIFFQLAGLKGNSAEGMKMLDQYQQALVPGSIEHLEFILVTDPLKDLLSAPEYLSWPDLNTAMPLYHGIALYDFALIRQSVSLPDTTMENLCCRLMDSGPGLIRPMVHYHYGVFLSRRLDPQATEHLTYFLDHSPGRAYRNAARIYLAWNACLSGDDHLYDHWLEQMDEKITFIEQDRQALQEKKSKPEPHLLAARLLFDGGYYQRALEQLEAVQAVFDSLGRAYQAEYHYRLGRIRQALGQHERALGSLDQVLDYTDVQRYFKANAALQAGIISLDTGKEDLARRYFEKALELDPGGYQSIKLEARKYLEKL